MPLIGQFGQTNPTFTAYDSHNVASGEQSWFDNLGETVSTAGKFTEAAAFSGLAGVYNSGVAITNFFGNDAQEIDVQRTLMEHDSDLGRYYAENQTAVDVLGFIGTSLIPGTLGTKAYTAGSRMALAARAGRVGDGLAEATGLFSPLREKYLSTALKEIGSSQGVVKLTNANYLKALGAGAADEALGALAGEAFIAASMFKSPVMEDMSAGEVASNMLFGGAIGGTLGGAIKGATSWGMLKRATKEADVAIKPFTQIDELADNATTELKIRNYAQQRLFGAEPLPNADNFEYLSRLKLEKDTRLENKLLTEVRKLTEGDDVDLARRFVADIAEIKDMRQLDASMFNLSKIGRVADDIAEGKPLAAGRAVQSGENVVYVNSRTGDVTGDLMPRLSDTLQAGEQIVVTPTAVRAGGRSYAMTFQDYARPFNVMNAATDRYEVEARYLWALENKFTAKEFSDRSVISMNDLPMMEAALKNWDKVVEGPGAVKITTGKGVDAVTITSPEQLDDHIRAVKLSMADNLIASGMDSREVAQRLNVTKSFAEDPATAFMREKGIEKEIYDLQSSYAQTAGGGVISPFRTPVHYKLEYAKQDLKQWTRDRVVAEAHYKAQNDMYAQEADGLVSGAYPEMHAQLQKFTAADMINANRMGAGSGTFTSASGEYFSLESAMERYGQVVANHGMQEKARALQAVQPTALALKADKQALAEFNLLDTTLRRNTDKYEVYTLPSTVPNEAGQRFMIPVALREKLAEMAASNDNLSLESFNNFLRQQHSMMSSAVGGMYRPVTNKEFAFEQFGGSGKIRSLADDAPVFIPMTEKVANFVQAHIAQNDRYLTKLYGLSKVRGIGMRDFRNTYYAPPIDLERTKYFAFVQDMTIGNNKHLGVLLARNSQELEQQISKLASEKNLKIITRTKGQVEEFKKAMGEYKYDLSIHENKVNSTLSRKGVLYQYAPPTDSVSVLEDYLVHATEKADQMVREYAAFNNSAAFETLKTMGKQHEDIAGSFMGSVTKSLLNSQKNPYTDYVKTALNISRRSEFPLLHMSDWIEDRVDDVWNGLKTAWNQVKNVKDEAQLQELNTIAMQRGLGTPYIDAAMESLGNTRPDHHVLRRAVGKINSVLSGTMLGMDALNAVNNTIGSSVLLSSEIRYVQKLIKDLPEAAELNKLLSVKVPGSEVYMQSPSKVIARSIQRFWKDDGTLLKEYQRLGFVQDELTRLKQMVFDASISGSETAAELNTKLEKVFDTARKWTGNKLAEDFNRFVAADIGHQLTDFAVKAGKMTPTQKETLMQTFVNRTQGNYLASQRPMITQGAVGQAMTLWLTYQMNMMQQMFKYVASGDKRAAITAMLTQGTMYGMQGLPGFSLVNQHIATMAGNEGHYDLYDLAQASVNNEAYEWMMYGLGSNIWGVLNSDLKVNLYTRGDLTPRNPLLFPTNIADLPAVALTSKFASNVMNVAQRIGQGGDVGDSVLMGLEHNGLNRPLSGLASILSGRSTTKEGGLINDIDLMSVSNFTRLVGGKPFDEANALDWYYRQMAYQAIDKDKLTKLGAAMKTTLENGDTPSADQMDTFLSSYVKAGGDVSNFNKFMMRQMTNANESQFATIKEKLRTPFAAYLQQRMGGAMWFDSHTSELEGSESATPASEEQSAGG